MKLNGVGEKTARKVSIDWHASDSVVRVCSTIGSCRTQQIMEIIQTGDLVRIQYETTEDIKSVREFTGIYGVGWLIMLPQRSIICSRELCAQAPGRLGPGLTMVVGRWRISLRGRGD